MSDPAAGAVGQQAMLPLSMVVVSGCLTAIILSALFVVKKESAKRKEKAIAEAAAAAAEQKRASAIDKEVRSVSSRAVFELAHEKGRKRRPSIIIFLLIF